MAHLTLNTKLLRKNYDHLDRIFCKNGIKWSVVTKLLCGNEPYLKEVLSYGVKQVCDSRLANLRTIKKLAPHVETIFIKPPAIKNAVQTVTYADISLNSSVASLRALSLAARQIGKMHKVIIMIETGERREGVMPQHIGRFYQQVHSLPNIEVIGLGTNLACMYGVLPDYDNLRQLELCRDIIEAKFHKRLDVLSGGASVTIPLLGTDEFPTSINHFRIGETLFFGTDVYQNSVLSDMHQDLFTLSANIIELRTKPNQPEGDLGYNVLGVKGGLDHSRYNTESVRAIIDVGLLDISPNHVTPMDDSIRIAGASSDMMVLDLDSNINQYSVGDEVTFRLDYMGVLQAMHSKYLEKKLESETHTTANSFARYNAVAG